MSDRKQFFTEDQLETPLVFAEGFINTDPSNNPNTGGPSSPEEALQVARMILATELGKDPLLRQVTRERFKAGAVVSIKPTEKGINKIDDQHPYAVSLFSLRSILTNTMPVLSNYLVLTLNQYPVAFQISPLQTSFQIPQ